MTPNCGVRIVTVQNGHYREDRETASAQARWHFRIWAFFLLLIYYYSDGFFKPIPQPWRTLIYLAIILPGRAVGLLAPWGIRNLQAYGSHGCGGMVLLLLAAFGYLVPHLLIIAEPRFPLAVRGWQARPFLRSSPIPILRDASAGVWLGIAF